MDINLEMLPFKLCSSKGHKTGDGTSAPYCSHPIQQLFAESPEHAACDSDTELADLANFAVCQLAQLPEDSQPCGICSQQHPFGECSALSNTCYMQYFVSATQQHHKIIHTNLKCYASSSNDKDHTVHPLTTNPTTPLDFCMGKEN
jgi:hypothetical protein